MDTNQLQIYEVKDKVEEHENFQGTQLKLETGL
jgi:hypothetical protein